MRPLACTEGPALTTPSVYSSQGQPSVNEAPVQVPNHTRGSRDAPALGRATFRLQVTPTSVIIYAPSEFRDLRSIIFVFGTLICRDEACDPICSCQW